jgi:hypothetical protein
VEGELDVMVEDGEGTCSHCGSRGRALGVMHTIVVGGGV